MRPAAAALLLLLTLPACTAAQQSAADMTLFRDVRVFDGERVHERTDVLVRGDRIVSIGSGQPVPAGATIVDGRGRTLLPGLIDTHTHTFGEALREALAFGVTTTLDMFTDVNMVAAWKAEQRAGRAHGRADILSAGTLVTAPGGHGTEYGIPVPTITEADSAQAFVDARLAEGSDWIKIVYDDGATFALRWPSISREVLQAVIESAHRRGRIAVVHVSTASSAYAAIEAGADGLVHLFTDTAARAGFAELARARGAFVIPTLVVMKSITGVGGGAPLAADPRVQPYLNDASLAMLAQGFPSRGDAARRFGFAQDAVRRLHEAGVPILAGSDAPNPGTAHGAALHRELELLVEAGLAPTAALASATSVAARAFGLDDRGRIVPGMRADLVLVAGDPTGDIAATRAIEGIWKEGVRFDRAAYAAMIAAERTRADRGRREGVISDFEGGTPATSFGTEWLASTDAFRGGSSTGSFEVVAGGAEGSAHSLRVTGTIAGAGAEVWSGIMWSPGTQPMTPADLDAHRGLSFHARGDGRTYNLLVFATARGMVPAIYPFTPAAGWGEVRVRWSELGLDGRGIMAIVISAGEPAGEFSLQVDNVRFF